MLTLNDGRSELWQWDTGRTVSVDADCSQVHFSNKVFGRSIDVDVVDGVAIIPDVLLQTDKDLNVWAFVGTAENGYTKISKTFKVNRRNKPADYVFTPPDQTSLEEIKEKIEYLESIQDPDAIKNAVEDYLTENPPKGEKGDPGNDYILTDADKEEIAEMAADLVEVPGSGGNVDEGLRTALVNYYTHVMPNFDDTNGLAYINAILTALGAETREEPDEPDEPDTPVEPDEPVTPEKTLSSISATYSGGDVAVGTAVTDLTGIVVTAHYSDGTSETVTGYTLSGTIAEGSNTVTVSYGGKTTTFTVTGVVEGGGGETEGTTVAMTKQFSDDNVNMKWYSDGGSTTATDCPGRNYLAILVSDNVFTEDTEVKITIVGSARLFDCWNVGCFDFASDGSFDINDSVYYAVHFGTNAWANTGATHEINYTVKAGYNLIITAYGNFADTTSVTVEVV